MKLADVGLITVGSIGILASVSYPAWGWRDGTDTGTNPRLVGYGCSGAGGPIYANEEDHFPFPCDAIEANDKRAKAGQERERTSRCNWLKY